MSKKDTAVKMAKFGARSVLYPKSATHTFRKIRGITKLAKEREKDYLAWFEAQQMTTAQINEQKLEAKKLTYKPLISIVVPLYNTPEDLFRECMESVLQQTYTNWELCLANDASPEPHVEAVGREFAKKYSNIKFINLEKNVHIVGASNEALKSAEGEFVSLLDHDDILMPNALFEAVKVLNANPKIDLIYTDEDKIDEKGKHIEPFFKPDWSPDFLKSCNYITHFSTLRKSIIDKIGGFRYGTEGAQDWDLLLRFTAETQNIYHIPKILYSWRKSETSTAKDPESKPYAYINQKRVLRDALANEEIATFVYENEYLGFWRASYAIKDNPKVSIVIPTKDNYKYISQCINSIIEYTAYTNFEIVIVDTGTTDTKTLDFYKSKVVKSNNIRIIHWKGSEFNFSSACNTGAKKASGEYLLFLNNDTEVKSNDWIESMLEHAQRDEIGMVGCKLLFESENIQHAGIVMRENDVAIHPFYNSHNHLDIFSNIYISNTRNCLAVTAACSMVSKKKFDKVGGFNEDLRITYNDVDLCLRLVEDGLYNVYTPYAQVYHHESISIGRISTSSRDNNEHAQAKAYMNDRWAKYIKRDPFYNENFVSVGLPYHLAPK